MNMQRYRFYLSDGSVQDASGNTVAEAWKSLGYGDHDVVMMDNYTIVDPVTGDEKDPF